MTDIEKILTKSQNKSLLVTENYVSKIIKGKSVLIIGAASSAEKVSPDFMERFELIVRINNYHIFNACNRTDVYYSMLGGSIVKTCSDLMREGCKLIFCKNPFDDYIVKDKNGKINTLKSLRFNRTYLDYRTRWFELPYYFQTIKNWVWLNEQIGQIVTTGLSAIVDIHRFEPSRMHVIGFDFFSSRMHYGYPIHIKPWPKHHDFKGEMLFARKFILEHKNITCDKTTQNIFDDPDKFPKMGNKP